MFKKFFTYPVFLVLFLAFIGAMGFGSIVKYKYEGGKKYQFLQKTVMFISEIPLNVKKLLKIILLILIDNQIYLNTKIKKNLNSI
jgi:hypothetical protein